MSSSPRPVPSRSTRRLRRRHRRLVVLGALVALATLGVAPTPAPAVPPPVTVGSATTISTTGATSHRLNGIAFQQDAITSHAGWQYAAYYVDVAGGRRVAISRRPLPTSVTTPAAWSAPIVFGDYLQTTNDSHNVISIGISPADGRIHIAFDMHSCQPGPGGMNLFNYRVSVAGLATSPASHTWDATKFGPVSHTLGSETFADAMGTCASGPSTLVTYPQFVTKPDGTKLMLSIRFGTPGAGDSVLFEYAGGAWSRIGRYIEGTSHGLSAHGYLNGLDYSAGGRLHATWVWRESVDLDPAPPAQAGTQLNHDLMYAYSDDDGRTWRNRPVAPADAEVYTAGTAPIDRASKVKVWDIPQGSCLLNQEAQTVDDAGRVHVLVRHTLTPTASCTGTPPPGQEKRWVHYFLGVTTNTWNRRVLPAGWTPGGRAKLVAHRIGGVDHVFALLPGRGLAETKVVSGDPWELVDGTTALPGDPLYDRAWARSTGRLAVFLQAGARVYSQEWDLSP